MKKFTLISVILLFLTIFHGAIVGAEPTNEGDTNQKVELTDAQKAELDALYKQLLETRKALINKYVEFDVISKEKAEKKIAWLEEHYNKIQEHGYIPKWDHHKRKMKDEE